MENQRATYKLITHQITHEPLTQVTLASEYPCISTLAKDMLVQFSEFEVPPRIFLCWILRNLSLFNNDNHFLKTFGVLVSVIVLKSQWIAYGFN